MTASLWIALTLPSLLVVQKYLGWSGTALYLAGAAVAVAIFRSINRPASASRARTVGLLTFALLTALVVSVHPLVNTAIPGFGSDDDDAYDVGAGALLDGRSPYSERTYLGNPLHQLPGAFILAAPFVLLGTSALQNPFWLAAFFAAMARMAGPPRALRLAWLVLIASPTVLHQLVTGTGHAANTIYVALGLIWIVESRGSIGASVFWGVALASRANFVLLLPLAAGWLVQHEGWRVALRSTAVTLVTLVAISLPFYLHDPAAFGPLEAADRLTRFDALFPHAGLSIAALAFAAAVGLSLLPLDRMRLFAGCAIVQAIPVGAGLVLGLMRDRWIDLAFAAYGTFFAWFALLAIGSVYQSDHDRTRDDRQKRQRGLTGVRGARKLGFERGS